MPVISSKDARGDDHKKFCTLLAQMLNPENSMETKRRLSLEVTKFMEGFKSFQELGAKYCVKVDEDIQSDGYLHVKIHVPKEFINVAHTGEDFVDFVINAQETKPTKTQGIGPVLSQEEADKIYKDENTIGVH